MPGAVGKKQGARLHARQCQNAAFQLCARSFLDEQQLNQTIIIGGWLWHHFLRL